MTSSRAQARVDLAAVASNVARLASAAPQAAVMAVVKADAYGHGLVACAQAARAGGAGWLGVALPEEALALRASGDTGRVLAWLLDRDDDWAAVVAADVDISVSDAEGLAHAGEAGRRRGRPARVHLKADTGLGRAGCPPAEWGALVAAAARAQDDGAVDVVGVWSHLAFADEPDNPVVDAQLAAFHIALDAAKEGGLTPTVRHLANSAATLTRPDTHFDLVRPGIAVYGVSPLPDRTADDLGLVPAMTLVARLALVKRVPAGHGVSYGHEYTTRAATTLALVPLGYADGIPRHAGNAGPVLAAGRLRRVAGRVCMDQFVLDIGDDPAVVGEEVVLFGPGTNGEPTAADWAVAAGTIPYEIVTRIGPRVPRVHLS